MRWIRFNACVALLLSWTQVQAHFVRAGSPAQDLLKVDANAADDGIVSSRHKLRLTHDLLGLHKNLTQIESITGNEAAVGEWLIQSLLSQGYNVDKQVVEDDPPRFNVLAWPGKERDAPLMLSSHIDTVPPFWPYRFDKENQTIHGRGSVDDKGSVAAQIIAVNNLIGSHRLDPDAVSLLFVVGEEVGGDGMRRANDLNLRPSTILFGEPTEGKLAAGHKGNLGVKLKAHGKAAHSGYPWLGRSANEVLVKALAALMELGPNLPRSEKYGVTTLNIGRIEGGVASNVIPESATADIAIRLAGGTPAEVKSNLTAAVKLAVRSFIEGDETASDVCEIVFASAGYGPIDIDHDVPGFETITVNYGTDIPWLDKTVKGQKRYLYGPGTILVAHSDHEALTVDQLSNSVDGYERLILHALEEMKSRSFP